jgi:hypothetical protein
MEIQKLNPKEIDALVEHFHGKFPLRIVYPPDRIIASKLKHNRLPDKPNSISFDLKTIVKTNNGIEVWRYAENVLVDNNNKKKYIPKKFIFSGVKMLDRNDIEQIYFLYKKSEFCLGGENQGLRPKFMFEDLVTDAEKKVAKKKIQTKIDMLLYGEEMAIGDEKLKNVAKAYFIKGVDDMTIARVKLSIEEMIKATKDGAIKFFEMVNADEEIKTRSSITKAIDLGILVFDSTGKNRNWKWKTKEGETNICRVPVDKTATEALYEHYLGNESFREDVQTVLLTKNPNAGKDNKTE